MNKARIEAIRGFADRVATWVETTNDRRLLHSLSFDKPWELRGALLRAQRESASGGQLLFGLDEFTNVWLSQEGDEYLVRDLVCVRVTETLHERRYFAANPDAVLASPATGATAGEGVSR